MSWPPPDVDTVRQFFFTPSYACDEDCLMCGVPRVVRRSGSRFAVEHWRDEIDRMGLLPRDILTFSGGEPLRAPTFAAAVEHARSHYGCRIWVLSNGRRLYDRRFAEKVAALGIEKLVVPVFSHDPAVHDRITQTRGSFAQTWSGLRHLAALGQKFQIKFIATALNHGDALDTYRMCRAEFPQARFVFSGLTMFGEAVANADQVAVRYADVAPSLDALLAEADGRGDLVPVFIFPLCHIDGLFWRHYNVGEFEEVVVAPDRQDRADGRTLEEGPKPEPCRGCAARRRCVFGWKPAYHERFGDGEFRQIRSDPLAA